MIKTLKYLDEFWSFDGVHVVDDATVEDVGDGEGFVRVDNYYQEKYSSALQEGRRWNGKEVKLPNFSSGFVVYTNQANLFRGAFKPDHFLKLCRVQRVRDKLSMWHIRNF